MPSNDSRSPLAVITGAGSGIGLAVARRLLREGTRVVAMARREVPPAELDEAGGHLCWLSGDVTRADDLQCLADLARELGPVDYLLPNAGIAQLADGLDEAAFQRQWAVNGAGALNTLAALRGQMARPSSVVFIGTFLSQVTFPGLAAYIASKSALKARARTLAVELAAEGIRVNIVSPGPTATPIWGTLGLDDEALGKVAATVSVRLLDGRFLEAEAVADAVLFMLSERARGIHGQDLVVDNGYTLR
ncbi:NAD(P)-dependent dehydrogenase, short-chain alcohol dehydrogenase family [Pseudomonas delhiensis]|uniref:NAD(P)-dependent dehydrogenase, short-chain alcohol dehydrogenase family n=1 Tax=Pseudomonas delhiensis TaxID=366289 RepID=A0A239KN55_9PSED|nr:SDR family oxidoreductase [Pseudomonas delhiensis]SDJ14535.1 NAD(P)-dependent dehydrogenase, short-chain alcohol dehydrogenase family [Pseudomonas delhiensis]SNT18999.1 NAD(P)-dependent dehydrogenase, short-chain alcohol dehydrogenase family [Pseudomonas delhiensis]